MHLADVVLQVKGCREVGLAVISRANQDWFVGSVDPFVTPQSFRFFEHLLACLACECGYNIFLKCKKQKQTKKGIDFSNFVLWPQHLPGCFAICL